MAEIGHEKAQSVIDSITNSYAAEGQPNSNPMLAPQGGPGGPMGPGAFPPPFGFGGMYLHLCYGVVIFFCCFKKA